MNIVLTGSVAFDYLMKFPGRFKEHFLPDKLESISLSFLVESMVRQRGGIAPNIAYTMALLGGKPKVFATVGEDFGDYRNWLENQNVDTSLMKVIPNEFTASFFANTDLDNNQISSFYPGAMGYPNELSFYDLDERPDLVMISPYDPEGMNKAVMECIDLGIPYFYDPSQQIIRLDSESLRKGIQGARGLFVNEYEFSLIQKHSGMNQAEILNHVDFLVVTLGEKGSVVYAEGEEIRVGAVPVEKVLDPTGVGDAYRGGFLIGYSQRWPWQLCAELGAMAASYCLEQNGTQNHSYTRLGFVKRFREHFDDRGLLNSL